MNHRTGIYSSSMLYIKPLTTPARQLTHNKLHYIRTSSTPLGEKNREAIKISRIIGVKDLCHWSDTYKYSRSRYDDWNCRTCLYVDLHWIHTVTWMLASVFIGEPSADFSWSAYTGFMLDRRWKRLNFFKVCSPASVPTSCVFGRVVISCSSHQCVVWMREASFYCRWVCALISRVFFFLPGFQRF